MKTRRFSKLNALCRNRGERIEFKSRLKFCKFGKILFKWHVHNNNKYLIKLFVVSLFRVGLLFFNFHLMLVNLYRINVFYKIFWASSGLRVAICKYFIISDNILVC